MGADPLDLCTRVLADWDAGMKAEEVAAKYRVSRAWVHRLVQRRRETGEIGPRQQTKFRARTLQNGHAGPAARLGDGAARSDARGTARRRADGGQSHHDLARARAVAFDG